MKMCLGVELRLSHLQAVELGGGAAWMISGKRERALFFPKISGKALPEKKQSCFPEFLPDQSLSA